MFPPGCARLATNPASTGSPLTPTTSGIVTVASFAEPAAPLVLLFSLVASGQIKLRKIDGWQKIGAVLNQHTAVAA